MSATSAPLADALHAHRSFPEADQVPALHTLRAERDVVAAAMCYRLVGQPTIELEALGITFNATVVQLSVDRPSAPRRVMRGVDQVQLMEVPAWLRPHVQEDLDEHWIMLGLHHQRRMCWWLIDAERYQHFVGQAQLLSNPRTA
jgi:hypothetical protein